MGKEFIEYDMKDPEMPYGITTICDSLIEHAQGYIKEETAISSAVDPKVRDAVVVDAINDLAIAHSFHLDLYTMDLGEEEQSPDIPKGKEGPRFIRTVGIDPDFLLTMAYTYFPRYLFGQDIVESVLTNNHMNEVEGAFDKDKAILVVVDFINYIARENGIDRVFSVKDLYEKYAEYKREKEMNILKNFLESTQQFTKPLANGESVDSLYARLLNKHRLKSITPGGKYYYNDKERKALGRKEMYPWDAYNVDKDLYALGYAYAKMTGSDITGIKPVDEFILQMK